MVTLLFLLLSSIIPFTFSTSLPPLLPVDFPDPSIIYSPQNRTWYAFSTSTRTKNIQVASSPSSPWGPWTLLESVDPLPDPGGWTAGPFSQTWAPSIVSIPHATANDTKYVLYYAAQLPSNSSAFHCVGAATSSTILGPYVPLPSPLACPLSRGGAIDPSGFLDPATGKRYLLYKVDGNSLGGGGSCRNTVPPVRNTPIMLQEVRREDGTTLVGEPVQVLDRDEGDGPLVEAPDLWYDAEAQSYVLFFSNHCWSEAGYSVNYAVSDRGIAGGYVKLNGTAGTGQGVGGKTGERALIRTMGQDGFNLTAPGGAASWYDEETGERGIVFHADCEGGFRCMFGAGVRFKDGRLEVFSKNGMGDDDDVDDDAKV